MTVDEGAGEVDEPAKGDCSSARFEKSCLEVMALVLMPVVSKSNMHATGQPQEVQTRRTS